MLANMYETGAGVAQDYAKAAALYGRICGAGEAGACVGLGALHERGLGVPKDDAKAEELFGKACDQKDPAGCAGLKRVTHP